MNPAEVGQAVQSWLADAESFDAGRLDDRVVAALQFENGRSIYMVAWRDDDGDMEVRLWDVADDHALDESDIQHLWDHHSREGAIAELEAHADDYDEDVERA